MTFRTLPAVALLLLAAPACDPDPPAMPTHTAAEVWAKARAAGTARVGVVVAVSGTGTAALRATGSGVVDLAQGRSAVRVDYDKAGRDLGLVTNDEVVDGPTTYLSRPGGPWFTCGANVGGARPYAAVAALADVADLTRVGEEVVRGTRTVHYTGRTGGLVSSIEVWVARDGLPRRVVATYGQVETETTVDLDAFGEPPPVTVPADATPVPDLGAAYDALAKS